MAARRSKRLAEKAHKSKKEDTEHELNIADAGLQSNEQPIALDPSLLTNFNGVTVIVITNGYPPNIPINNNENADSSMEISDGLMKITPIDIPDNSDSQGPMSNDHAIDVEQDIKGEPPDDSGIDFSEGEMCGPPAPLIYVCKHCGVTHYSETEAISHAVNATSCGF